MKRIILILVVFCFFNMSSHGLTIAELERTITEAESRGNVHARSYIHFFWQLADLYLANNDYENA